MWESESEGYVNDMLLNTIKNDNEQVSTVFYLFK